MQYTYTNDLIKNCKDIANDYYITLTNENNFLTSSGISCIIPETLKLLKIQIDNIKSSFNVNHYNSFLNPQSLNSTREIKWRKIFIPVNQFPKCNIVGRILGPKGLTVRKLEAMTGCKIRIRGKGSIKNSELSNINPQKIVQNHLNEPLHVLILAEDNLDIVEFRLNLAEHEIRKFIFSVIRKKNNYNNGTQLSELIVFNGTFKKNNKDNCESFSSINDIINNQGNNFFYNSLNILKDENILNFENTYYSHNIYL
ncbi:Protein quaking [Strongyloides ratti]|uniref:Protein quaking n=1 Tax=Strongyloides ratti TaxID=34506 RepID=A0A090LF46_STRRB|nr:Protein quaking [Strongyloides ratti]CEF66135.1 Protein quaking [Strongyloides ratti]